MIGLTYLAVLIISICGLATIDHRFKLAYFAHRRATLLTVLFGVLFFSLWDVAGIISGIFFTGQTTYLTGIVLGPEYPLEELFFLILLSYNALIVWTGLGKLWPRT